MIVATLVLGATLTLADLRKVVSVGQPEISPDATHILVSISQPNYDKDQTDTDLVMIDVSTRAQRKLLHHIDLSVYAWSPSGAEIAYIASAGSANDKASELFVLPMNGGEPRQ